MPDVSRTIDTAPGLNYGSPDKRAGMAWWNGMTEYGREYWLERARRELGRTREFDASAAEAWESYKRENQNSAMGG